MLFLFTKAKPSVIRIREWSWSISASIRQHEHSPPQDLLCEAAPLTDRTDSNAYFHLPVSFMIDAENLMARLTFLAIGDVFEVSATRAIAH